MSIDVYTPLQDGTIARQAETDGPTHYRIAWTSVDGYGPSPDKADLYSGTNKYAMIALCTSLQHGANLSGNPHGHQYRVYACYRSRQLAIFTPEATL